MRTKNLINKFALAGAVASILVFILSIIKWNLGGFVVPVNVVSYIFFAIAAIVPYVYIILERNYVDFPFVFVVVFGLLVIERMIRIFGLGALYVTYAPDELVSMIGCLVVAILLLFRKTSKLTLIIGSGIYIFYSVYAIPQRFVSVMQYIFENMHKSESVGGGVVSIIIILAELIRALAFVAIIIYAATEVVPAPVDNICKLVVNLPADKALVILQQSYKKKLISEEEYLDSRMIVLEKLGYRR